jgi:hypothetical protein
MDSMRCKRANEVRGGEYHGRKPVEVYLFMKTCGNKKITGFAIFPQSLYLNLIFHRFGESPICAFPAQAQNLRELPGNAKEVTERRADFLRLYAGLLWPARVQSDWPG